VNFNKCDGDHSGLVVEADQRNEDGDIQRARGDRRYEANVQNCIQTKSLYHSRDWLLRVANNRQGKAAWYFTPKGAPLLAFAGKFGKSAAINYTPDGLRYELVVGLSALRSAAAHSPEEQ
jgi:hypothetical protein